MNLNLRQKQNLPYLDKSNNLTTAHLFIFIKYLMLWSKPESNVLQHGMFLKSFEPFKIQKATY